MDIGNRISIDAPNFSNGAITALLNWHAAKAAYDEALTTSKAAVAQAKSDLNAAEAALAEAEREMKRYLPDGKPLMTDWFW